MGLSARSKFSPRQSRAARALLGWTQDDLAQRARMEPEAVEMYESEAGALGTGDLIALGLALNCGGVIALPIGWAGEGVRLSYSPGWTVARRRVDVDGPFDLINQAEALEARGRHER